MKKILTIKIAIICGCLVGLVVIIIGIIAAITGASFGYNAAYTQSAQITPSGVVLNNQLYADRYRKILNKHLIDKGYVTLERLVFYLQRTNNVLDVTTLSDEVWEDAYLKNLNEELKQMVPIKTLCEEFNKDKTLPSYTITSDTNSNGVMINALNLCVVNDVDITKSSDYTNAYSYHPFVFPLQNNFSVTSIVFENRNLDLNISDAALARANYHSGWDFGVPVGTNFYSICSGTIKSVVNTQFNDLPFNQSGNSTGNYIEVECDNKLTAQYFHIKPTTYTFGIRVGAKVKQNQLLGQTSTTGLSTGPHLHLGLKDSSGNLLDALEYIDFNYKE